MAKKYMYCAKLFIFSPEFLSASDYFSVNLQKSQFTDKTNTEIFLNRFQKKKFSSHFILKGTLKICFFNKKTLSIIFSG